MHRLVVDELVRDARPEQSDAVAAVLRAKIKQALVGTGAPPTIGRFSVLQRVGSGGFGIVYAAYDPLLDRRVALKVLSHGDNEAILREARALARLRHENVVAVHEAGSIDGHVWIAMEFVEGQTLREWLADEHTDAEIEDALLGAGRGLAAAHAAGLAHGDFKPQNVLVGADGVRVADFGMATLIGDDAVGQASSGGTPQYMAPERLEGGPATPAADQFAFAVTVYEAATGARPSGDDEPKVPRSRARWVAAARRGLAGAPQARFESIDAMLAAIRPRRRGTTRTAAALVVTAAVTAGVVAALQGAAPCETAAEEIAVVDPIPGPLGVLASEHLDSYRRDWIAAHREVCEATRVHATQSDTLFDVRMRCLARRRSELGALTGLLGQAATPRELADAFEAVDALRPPADCTRIEADDPAATLPEDAAARQEATRLRGELDRSWALYRLARYDPALQVADAVLAAAETLGFGPVRAEALFFAGTVRGRVDRPSVSEPLLQRALVEAAAVGDHRLAAEVSLQLLRSLMFRHQRQRVVDLADFVRADAVRAGGDPNEVDGIVGEAWLHDGAPAQALPLIERARSTEHRQARLAILLSLLGSTRLQLGERAGALEAYRLALETAKAHFGPDHPEVGFHLQRFGRGQLAMGHAEDAHRTLTEALRLRETALGPDDRAIASALADLAKAEVALGHPDRARSDLERALRIRTEALGPDDPGVDDLRAQLSELVR